MQLKKITTLEMENGRIEEKTTYELRSSEGLLDITLQDLQELNKLTWQVIRPDQPPARENFTPGAMARPLNLVPGKVAETEKNEPGLLPSWAAYADRIIDGESKEQVMEAMAKDRKITIFSASTSFYRYVKPIVDNYQEVKETEQRADDGKTSIRMGDFKMEVTGENITFGKSTTRDEIERLPDFQTAHQFNDHCLANEIGNELSLRELKKIYLETHPHIKW